MENSSEKEQLAQLLAEAVEILDDVKDKLALFDRQHYFKLKAKIAAHHIRRSDASTVTTE